MTLPPDPYSDASSPDTAPVPTIHAGATTPGRPATEPLRPLAAGALLVGNAVLLFIGFSDLFFVVDGWSSQFGLRSAATFGAFAGPIAIALPLLAVLLATHIAPTLPQVRNILIVALAEYGVSAALAVITYLGAFASGLFSVRATFDGLLGRSVWLAFLTIAGMAVYRVYRAMNPVQPPKAGYAYGPTVYGRPYPGQPSYPQPATYPAAPAESTTEPIYDPGTFDAPTAETGWPVVGAPGRPEAAPAPVEPDPTTRMSAPREAPGDATRLMPPVQSGPVQSGPVQSGPVPSAAPRQSAPSAPEQ